MLMGVVRARARDVPGHAMASKGMRRDNRVDSVFADFRPCLESCTSLIKQYFLRLAH